MTIFLGMEAIDTKEDIDQEVIQEDITPMLFDLLNDENALAKDLLDVDQMFAAEDKFNTAFEQLEALRDSIEEFGLSKGVIKAVDPDGYLSANGIIPAYEKLNDLPTKDEKAEAALESINGALSKALKKIKEFMASLWNKIKGIFTRVLQMFQSYEKILTNLSERLGKTENFIGSEIRNKYFRFFGKKEFENAFSFYNSDVYEIYNTLIKMLNDYNKEIEDIINSKKIINSNVQDQYSARLSAILKHNVDNINKYFGIEISVASKTFIFGHSNKYFFKNTKRDLIKNFGYKSPSDIKNTVDNGIKFIKKFNEFKKIMKDVNKHQKDFLKTLEKSIDNKYMANLFKNHIDFSKALYFITYKIMISGNKNGIKLLKEIIKLGKIGLSISK